MISKEQIDEIVSQIIEIEKHALKGKFDAANGNDERFSVTKADTEVVNNILSLIDCGKDEENENKKS
ncbi:MAG: hypothetical protein J1F18_04660 [Lachnospiraceae bacterium]|nr:hypothetical protein [Lachnospiraceae bacterium]